MQTDQAQPLADLWRLFPVSAPDLTVGLTLIAIGLIVGWLSKRAVMRVLVWLRLDRLAGRVGWRSAFGKGDVRDALYGLAGTLVGFAVFLVFLDEALGRWHLTAVSRIVDGVVFYIPNLALVAVIVGVGLLVSNGLATRVAEALEEEGVPRAQLMGKLVKGALVAIVVALALWQLHFAREIVLAGFVIVAGSLGIAFALGAGLGAARAVEHGLTRLLHRNHED